MSALSYETAKKHGDRQRDPGQQRVARPAHDRRRRSPSGIEQRERPELVDRLSRRARRACCGRSPNGSLEAALELLREDMYQKPSHVSGRP